MGILERFRPTEVDHWQPPRHGACNCEGHIEDILSERVPLADGSGTVAVWALLTSGALATVPLAEDEAMLTNGLTTEWYGPFHWRVSSGVRLRPFLADGAAIGLDDALYVQPSVERVMQLNRGTELVIAAPGLCINGVQCLVVQALLNPRLRLSTIAG